MTDRPRFCSRKDTDAVSGSVHWDPVKSVWISLMVLISVPAALFSLSVTNFAVFIICSGVTLCAGHSLGMHRLLIHRSWRTFRWLEYLFVWLGVLVGMAGPVGMVRTHDLRDWAQRQPHCHDYFAHRQPWWRDLWWQVHCDVKLTHPPRFEPEALIADDRVYALMQRFWMAQQLLPAMALGTVGGWEWVVWGVMLRIVVSVFGHWLIGYFAHNRGERHWHVRGAGVQGYNVGGVVCGLITMGESWHNNHHSSPGSARIGRAPGELDPGWWVLQVMHRVGLAWEISVPDVSVNCQPICSDTA